MSANKTVSPLRSEVYESLYRELEEKGFSLNIKFDRVQKKQKKIRILINSNSFSFEALSSKDDKLFLFGKSETEVLPPRMELKFAKNEEELLDFRGRSDLPVVVFFVGLVHHNLNQLLIEQYYLPLALVWWNPSQRPLLSSLLRNLEAEKKNNDCRENFEKMYREQIDKFSKIENFHALYSVELEKTDLYFAKIEFSMEQMRRNVQEMNGAILKIQGDIQEMKGDIQGLKGDIQELNIKVETLEDRIVTRVSDYLRDTLHLVTN